MNCTDFEERIHRLLDHRVCVTDDRGLAQHATVCPQCRSMQEAYADLDAGLAACDIPSLDDDFVRRVLANVEPTRPVIRVPLVRLTIAAVAAGLLIALLPTMRNAWVSSATKPVPSDLAVVTHRPDGAALAPMLLGPEVPDFTVLTLLPPEFLRVPSAFVRQPLGSVWQDWTNTLAHGGEEFIEPMVGIRDGLRPITSTLTGTLDALRNAIPLDLGTSFNGTSTDSASAPLAQPANPAV